MTSKLVPSDPASVMVIRKLSPNITTCSSPFARFGRFKVGGRGTIVRLQNNTLAVFSPVALTPDVHTVLTELGGNVRYITALDYEHHVFISDWAKAFPSAKVLGVEGLPEKRESSKETAGIKFDYVWTKGNKADLKVDPEFDGEFEYEYVHSHGNKELVFYHVPDKTLIEADLLFNLPATEQYSRTPGGAESGYLTKFFTGLQNTKGTAIWQQRFLWYVVSAKDRQGFSESIKKINRWDIQKIIPCHGDVIEKDAKGIFQKVMEWHLNSPQA